MKEISIFSSDNISIAWAKLFMAIAGTGGKHQPACISIHNSNGTIFEENLNIRHALDDTLKELDKIPVRISSMVVFPYQDWLRLGRPTHDIFRKRCIEQAAPRLRELNSKNRDGVYFERMMNYNGVDKNEMIVSCDQLGEAIDFWKHTHEFKQPKRPRRSAMQIACFDPPKDMKQSPYSIFPCLQQVGISYDDNKDEFYLNAYYPVQYVLSRAYGNFLGLCGLGDYLATHIKTKFAGLNCFVGIEELEVKKTDVAGLLDVVTKEIPEESIQEDK